MTRIDDSKKVVWAYMVEQGKLTNGQWSYYGGDWEDPSRLGWDKIEKENREFKEKVKAIGVDWEKTKHPESSIESAFEDTFHPSSSVETLLGVLVLKDGSEYTVGVGNANRRFSEYMRVISEYIDDFERVNKVLGE